MSYNRHSGLLRAHMSLGEVPDNVVKFKDPDHGGASSKYQAPTNNDDEPRLSYHSYGNYTVGGDQVLHHLIISVREADITNWSGHGKCKSFDPFVRILFDNTDESKPEDRVQTRKIYKSDGHPKWNFVKRFTFRDKANMPEVITFAVMKYKYHHDGKDVFIGQHVVNLAEKELMSKEQNMYETTCALFTENGMNTNCKIRFGIYYKHCSLEALTAEMMNSREECAKSKLYPDILDWIDDNKKLIKKLKINEKLNVQLSFEDFSDLNFPSYQLMKEGHRRFLESYQQISDLYGFHPNRDGHGDDENDGDDEKHEMKEKKHKNFQIYYDTDCEVLYYANSESFFLGGENITAQVQILFRYVFLKDVLLKGQDSEFNIYRSYYLEPRGAKIALALLALMLQITLTLAVSWQVWTHFGVDMFVETDWLIITGAFMTFAFSGSMTWSTAHNFAAFYKALPYGYRVPWFLILADYTSNIVLGLYICLISLFFLLQSPDYVELVLNAFALLFIVQIDDMINVFESDEDMMIMADLRKFQISNCETPRQIRYRQRDLLGVLLSPFNIFYVFRVMIEQFYALFIKGYDKIDKRV